MAPLVCVVLLNWNQCEDTLLCLESLAKISYSPTRIVVVDNGSTDDSVALIRRRYPAVEVIALRHNAGCAGGRNLGLTYARSLSTDFILFLDNDTVVDPRFLCHLIDAAEKDPSIGILSSRIVLNSNPSICWTAGGVVNANGTVDALHYYTPSCGVPDYTFKVDWVPGCVLMMRREVYESIGEFDNSYFIYFEDVDWCIRASKRGYRIVVVPRSVVYHKVSQSSGGDYSPTKLYYWSRNRLYFMHHQTRGLQRLWTTVSLISEDITDGFGDIVLMKKPGHAKARWIGTLHFLLRRRGFYSL